MRSRRRRLFQFRTEVNLTPLIDVMTSLLAIFMITAPLLSTGIALDLPKGDGQSMTEDEKSLIISVDRKGQIFLAQQVLTPIQLLDKLKAITQVNPQQKMIISADKHVPYGQVVELMALLRQAGFSQVGLKTDIDVVQLDKMTHSRKKQ